MLECLLKPEYATGEPGIKIVMIPGKPNPSTGIDDYEIHNYWYCPNAFFTEFIGRNKNIDDDYIIGETGALKRHCIHAIMMLETYLSIKPISILVCIENLQRYYTDKIFTLQEEIRCLEQPSTSSTPE